MTDIRKENLFGDYIFIGTGAAVCRMKVVPCTQNVFGSFSAQKHRDHELPLLSACTFAALERWMERGRGAWRWVGGLWPGGVFVLVS